MIDWIDQRCRDWGHQVKYIYFGRGGWPPKTTLARMIEEGILGASAGRFVQHFPEFMPPECQQINNAVKRLVERDREVLFRMYVVKDKAKVLMAEFSMSRNAFYDFVDGIHKRLSASLYLNDKQNTENCRRIPTDDFGMVRA